MWGGRRLAVGDRRAEGLAQDERSGGDRAIRRRRDRRESGRAAEYRAGKTNVLGFLVGQVMKASRGKADPALVNELVRKKLC